MALVMEHPTINAASIEVTMVPPVLCVVSMDIDFRFGSICIPAQRFFVGVAILVCVLALDVITFTVFCKVPHLPQHFKFFGSFQTLAWSEYRILSAALSMKSRVGPSSTEMILDAYFSTNAFCGCLFCGEI